MHRTIEQLADNVMAYVEDQCGLAWEDPEVVFQGLVEILQEVDPAELDFDFAVDAFAEEYGITFPE